MCLKIPKLLSALLVNRHLKIISAKYYWNLVIGFGEDFQHDHMHIGKTGPIPDTDSHVFKRLQNFGYKVIYELFVKYY